MIFYCKGCDCDIKGYDEIMKHCKRHLEHILEKGYTQKITDKEEDRPIVLAFLKARRQEDRNTEQKDEGN